MEYTVVAVLLSVFTDLIWCQNAETGKQFPLDINFGEDISGGHEGLFSLLGFSDNSNKEEKPGFNFANDKNYQDLLSELFPGLRYDSPQTKQNLEVPKSHQPQKVTIAPSKIVVIKPLPYTAGKNLQINPNLLQRGPNLFPGSVKEVPTPSTKLLPPPEHKINDIPVSAPQFKKDGQFQVENHLNIYDTIKNDSSQQIPDNFGLKEEEKFNFNQGQNKENGDPLSYSSYLLSNEEDLHKIFNQDNSVPSGFKQISGTQQNSNEKPKVDDGIHKHSQNNINVNLDDLGEVLSILRINPDGTEESAILTHKDKNVDEINFQKYLNEQNKLLQNENDLKPKHQNHQNVQGEEKIIENIRYVNSKDNSNGNSKSEDKLNDDLVSSLEIVSNFFKNQDEFNKKVYANAQNDYNQVLAKQSTQFYKSGEPNYDVYSADGNTGEKLNALQEKIGTHQDTPAVAQSNNKDIFFINDDGLGKIAANPDAKQKSFIVYFSDPKSKGEQAGPNRSGGSATSYSRVSLPGRNYNNNLEH